MVLLCSDTSVLQYGFWWFRFISCNSSKDTCNPRKSAHSHTGPTTSYGNVPASPLVLRLTRGLGIGGTEGVCCFLNKRLPCISDRRPSSDSREPRRSDGMLSTFESDLLVMMLLLLLLSSRFVVISLRVERGLGTGRRSSPGDPDAWRRPSAFRRSMLAVFEATSCDAPQWQRYVACPFEWITDEAHAVVSCPTSAEGDTEGGSHSATIRW